MAKIGWRVELREFVGRQKVLPTILTPVAPVSVCQRQSHLCDGSPYVVYSAGLSAGTQQEFKESGYCSSESVHRAASCRTLTLSSSGSDQFEKRSYSERKEF